MRYADAATFVKRTTEQRPKASARYYASGFQMIATYLVVVVVVEGTNAKKLMSNDSVGNNKPK